MRLTTTYKIHLQPIQNKTKLISSQIQLAYVNLPKRDGGSSVYQFSKDKTKRKLVTKTFTDPVTHQPKTTQMRVEYNVIDPSQTDQGESYWMYQKLWHK
jgi:hypothetical protein